MITSLFYFDGQGKVGAHLSFLVFACPTAFVVEATLYLSPARPEVERRGARWRPINYLLLSLEIGIKNNFCKVCQALFWQTTFAMIIHKRLAQNVCVREREGRLAVRGNTKESPRCAPSPRGCCSYKYLGCFPSRGEPPFLPLFFFFLRFSGKTKTKGRAFLDCTLLPGETETRHTRRHGRGVLQVLHVRGEGGEVRGGRHAPQRGRQPSR
jgi:hypothetical protein